MSSPFTVAFVLGATPGKWARVWNERLPETTLDLVAAEQEVALDMLRAGTADVALLRLPVDRAENSDRPLAAIPLYTERAVVVVPKGHASEALDSVALAELEAENVIQGDWRDAVELVAANVGVAVLPQAVARALTRKDVVTRMLDDGPEWQVAVVWRDGSVDPLVEEFIGIVRGRTARSSRGTATANDAAEDTPPSRAAQKSGNGNKKSSGARSSGRTHNGKGAAKRPARAKSFRPQPRKG
ncbi:LysR family transcriptional regulator substrate-binding protein [Salinibacterium sp. NK8237]|uniref:LysR family transcriptional regulator substrate-binding protein n=1 Tax=Salinibacterium sp. NK8237 TaxID=2792038 RepID=UPI0018CD81AD|nr:LysR family transcriptional regulator substrate-binding protein [Salinibacterium sp. NK8237]MBH0128980.1 LysR family transcriptional regulator substrate-binding protein [Salinibacterium sp. NK8237]